MSARSRQRWFALGLLVFAHGIWAQWDRGRQSENLALAKDSIAVLEPVAAAFDARELVHAAEVTALEEVHADSVEIWTARLAASLVVVEIEDQVYDSIEGQIRAQADARTNALLDGLTASHDRALEAAAAAVETATKATDAERAQKIMWRDLATERLEGWDNERALRIQEAFRADAAEILASPPLSLRIVKGLPAVALGALAVLLLAR